MTLVSLFAGIGGFDLGFERAGIRSVRYRMLGNAVCVNVAEWIAGRLAAAGADPRDQADKGERQ